MAPAELKAVYLITGGDRPKIARALQRLRTRFDKRDDIHQAFLTLAEVVICWRRLGSLMEYF